MNRIGRRMLIWIGVILVLVAVWQLGGGGELNLPPQAR